MEGIVLELQHEALQSDADILALLRKAYTIAKKLKLKDFENWVTQELNGYTDIDKIPNYREVEGELMGLNPYRGWIPVLFESQSTEDIITHQVIKQSLSNLIDLYNDGESSSIVLLFNSSINQFISRGCGDSTKFQLQVSKSQLKNIIETVKTTILDWTIELESNGIIGNGLSFNSDEIQKAQTPSVYAMINLFKGNASNIQVQQATDDSEQSL